MIPFITAKPRVKYPLQQLVEGDEFKGDYITLGKVINTVPAVEARLPLDSLSRHILIIGATGTGKSYTASRIALRTSLKGIPVLVFDWHGEYGGILEESVSINPFEKPVELLGSSDIRVDAEVLTDVLGLTPPQEYLLWKILSEKGKRVDSVESLIRAIESHYDEAGWVREARLSLYRKIKILAVNPYLKLFEGGDEGFLEELTPGKPVLIDLSLIRNTTVRGTYGTLLLARLINRNYGLRRKHLVLLEEAHNYLGRENPIWFLARMMGEIRKNNIGFCVITQSPSLIMDHVLVNTNTKIVHSVKASVDLELVSRSLFVEQEIARILPYLSVGEALLYNPVLKKPLLIRVE